MADEEQPNVGLHVEWAVPQEGVIVVESSHDLPSEHCNEPTYEGYGLAYGGIGVYAACNVCGQAWKRLDDASCACLRALGPDATHSPGACTNIHEDGSYSVVKIDPPDPDVVGRFGETK